MPEFLTDISTYKDHIAILLAALSLLYTTYQFSTQKRHNKLMIRPHLDSVTEVDDDNRRFVIEITNNGIGPAVITHAEIYYRNKLVEGQDPVESAMKAISTDLPNHFSGWGHHSVAIGSYVSPGEKINLIDAEFYVEVSATSATDFRRYLDENAELKIWYKSIYGEEFLYVANDPLSSMKPLCRFKWFRKSIAKHHSV